MLKRPRRPLWSFRAPFDEKAERFIREWAKPLRRGQPAAYHKWEWVRTYETLFVELLERYDCYHHDDDPPPTRLEVCQLVAVDDFERHPERWDYDPDERPDKAARRVWGAVKPVLALNEKVLQRAAKIRQERGL